MAGLRRITEPEIEPVSLVEAKAHLNFSTGEDDDLIASVLVAARSTAEDETNRALLSQTWKLSLDRFPCAEERYYPSAYPRLGIYLPRGNVTSITSFSYTDEDGVAQVLADYQLDDSSPHGAAVYPAVGASWPATQPGKVNAVEITYVAGWATAGEVPGAIRQAIKFLVGHYYENREEVVTGTIASEIPQAAATLLERWRVPGFA